MNARMLGLFSGFPARQFPQDIARHLQDELTVRNSLVFISAWPSDYVENDNDAAGMHGMFVEWDMPFRQFAVIDRRTDAYEAKRLIKDADCIFLMGGNATDQYRLIEEKGIADDIRRSTAVILGVSAGASNMAERALDIWENYTPYEGLGLTKITVKAHVGRKQRELLSILLRISETNAMPICAIADDSAIFIRGREIICIGEILWLCHGMIHTFPMIH